MDSFWFVIILIVISYIFSKIRQAERKAKEDSTAGPPAVPIPRALRDIMPADEMEEEYDFEAEDQIHKRETLARERTEMLEALRYVQPESSGQSEVVVPPAVHVAPSKPAKSPEKKVAQKAEYKAPVRLPIRFNSKSVVQAVVFSEIIGPCKANAPGFDRADSF